MSIKVLIYDDNSDRRESLTFLLQTYPEFIVCQAFPNCFDVVEDINEYQPDIVLMDIQMPKVDGLQGVALIKQNYPDVKVIMQTVFEDDDKVFQAILNGASGYILKRTPSDKIIEAIHDVLDGGSPMTPSIAAKMLAYFRQQADTQTTNYALTEKEKNILDLMVAGLSYKMIAARCSISFHTVNTHIKKIYEKLHVHSASEAVAKALKEKIVTR